MTPKAARSRYIGVREFKEDLTGYLSRRKEVVVTRRGKPIARVVPVEEGTVEDLLLKIGKMFEEAGVSKEDALEALRKSRKSIYG
jgi:prevent-host-death family protein